MLLIEDWLVPEIRAISPPPPSLDQMRQQRAAKCSQVQERQGLYLRKRERERKRKRKERKKRWMFRREKEACSSIRWTVVIHKDISFFATIFFNLTDVNHSSGCGLIAADGVICLTLQAL
ncbi:hypothetical protein ATANTOWER_006867 [Ataeniobius toweri]|uniref:Uncharacterized protein n=1 Tax=Ataeniobius toweri TaxID=208326 RepID=A0ABU7BE83_9TELE|nr:hypothetical protein [Ataeniobius toweri]